MKHRRRLPQGAETSRSEAHLDEAADQQLVAVVTTNIDDPKDAYKTAEKYVDNIMKSLE